MVEGQEIGNVISKCKHIMNSTTMLPIFVVKNAFTVMEKNHGDD